MPTNNSLLSYQLTTDGIDATPCLIQYPTHLQLSNKCIGPQTKEQRHMLAAWSTDVDTDVLILLLCKKKMERCQTAIFVTSSIKTQCVEYKLI